jgi:hypothetical protein
MARAGDCFPVAAAAQVMSISSKLLYMEQKEALTPELLNKGSVAALTPNQLRNLVAELLFHALFSSAMVVGALGSALGAGLGPRAEWLNRLCK